MIIKWGHLKLKISSPQITVVKVSQGLTTNAGFVERQHLHSTDFIPWKQSFLLLL